MPPKENDPNGPTATRKRKSEGDDENPKPKTSYRKLMPASEKPRRNPGDTMVPDQHHSLGHGPVSRPQGLAAVHSPAIQQEASGAPSFPRLMHPYGSRNEQEARDYISHLYRTGNMGPAVPSSGMMSSQPPLPPSQNVDGFGVPNIWYPEYERMFQESLTREQGGFLSEPTSMFNLNMDGGYNGADFGWMSNTVVMDPQFFPHPAPLQNGHESAVTTPDTIFSLDHASASFPGSYDGTIDPAILSSANEAPRIDDMTIPMNAAQAFNNTEEGGVDVGSNDLLPQIQEQQPQPPFQTQGIDLHQDGSYNQQPPTYAQSYASGYIDSYPSQQQQPWSMPIHANGFPLAQPQSWYMPNYTYDTSRQQALPSYTPTFPHIPLQQQQPLPSYAPSSLSDPLQQQQRRHPYMSLYANRHPQQHRPAPQRPPWYQSSHASPTQFNNIVGQNIMLNHVPSLLSLSVPHKNPASPDIGQQNYVQQPQVESTSGQNEAAKEEEESFLEGLVTEDVKEE
ncbi:hypothetical protein GT037_006343 [Alternaria burnsii]|uniref:Uncharacterized protein n=1 Tax=Alternaria burnsii TaxID=1187904 RepID=A0A8H7B5S6_9PLEO|nr:uncharacterized protein GT037_006343 [Alternaria burnsii]KAF7675624.1 hypothetical protein GT037_006343 [Alternaria burnsii]CAI9632596.1 unnamed protein product [Alternaria burnsii]